MIAIALLGTHKCYDRGRGLCCVTCGNICDFVQLGTHRCYDRGRGTWCVTCGNIIIWFRPTEDTQVLRQRTWYVLCYMREHMWYRQTEDTQVLRQMTWYVLCYVREHFSVIAPIWGHTCVRICDWYRHSGDTHVLRQRTWCIRCLLWELWFRPTAWGHTRVTTEDVVRAVLPGGTFISDSAHIWGHIRVRSCDWYRPSGIHMYYDRGPCCVTCGIILENEAFVVFAYDLVTYSLL